MVESFRQKVYKNIRYNGLYIDHYLKIKAGYRHPRSIPIISPSKEFDANVKKIFDKGFYTTFFLHQKYKYLFPVYASQREHLTRYVEAGNHLNKFIKHRKGEEIDWIDFH